MTSFVTAEHTNIFVFVGAGIWKCCIGSFLVAVWGDFGNTDGTLKHAVERAAK